MFIFYAQPLSFAASLLFLPGAGAHYLDEVASPVSDVLADGRFVEAPGCLPVPGRWPADQQHAKPPGAQGPHTKKQLSGGGEDASRQIRRDQKKHEQPVGNRVGQTSEYVELKPGNAFPGHSV